MPTFTFRDVRRATGSQGERKGLEPFAGHIVTLTDFKLELRGRDKDEEGNPKEQRRILTALVTTEGVKPRRARIPVRYAQRFQEMMEYSADSNEPFVVENVLVLTGEHGATLHDPNDVPQERGGLAPNPGEQDHANGANGTARRRGRPRRTQDAAEQHAPEGEPVPA